MRSNWMLFGGGSIALLFVSAIYFTYMDDSSGRRTGRIVYEIEAQNEGNTNESAMKDRSETIVEQSRLSVETVRRMGGTVLLSDGGQVLTINLTGCAIEKGHLELLKDTPELYLLNLDNSTVSDDDLRFVHDLPRLRYLRLCRTQVTDNGLKYLKNLPALTNLFINDTSVTDAGIQHLRELSGLTSIAALGTQVTSRSQENLQETLPTCFVKYRLE